MIINFKSIDCQNFNIQTPTFMLYLVMIHEKQPKLNYTENEIKI